MASKKKIDLHAFLLNMCCQDSQETRISNIFTNALSNSATHKPNKGEWDTSIDLAKLEKKPSGKSKTPSI